MKHYLFRLKTVLDIMDLQISNELKFWSVQVSSLYSEVSSELKDLWS